MHAQTLRYSSQLKAHLRKLRDRFPNVPEWDNFYRLFKKLDDMIEQLCQSKQKTPPFFQLLHDTTIDMRANLLADLAARMKKEAEQEQLLTKYENQLHERDQLIARLSEEKDHKQPQIETTLLQQLESQISKLKKQIQKLKTSNDELTQKLKRQESAINSQVETRKLKEGEATTNKMHLRALPPSPDPVTDSRETVYDNISDCAGEQRNYTEWDHNYSQQGTERKAKSAYMPRSLVRIQDQLERFIYIQAVSIEEFLRCRQ